MPSAADRRADTRPPADGHRRVLQHGRASITSSVADAVVVKHDELFFLCDRNGDVPFDPAHGLGLYYHDCRYLDGYELRVGGKQGERLTSGAGQGFWATFELTNPDLESDDGRRIDKESLGIRWERTLDTDARALRDTIALTNFSLDAVHVPVAIRLRARFDSVLGVRGADQKQRGTLHPPCWRGGVLEFRYDGADGIRRTMRASFDPPPARADGAAAVMHLAIGPRETATLSISLVIDESPKAEPGTSARPVLRDVADVRRTIRQSIDRWIADSAAVDSDSPLLNRVMDRSLRDLHLLCTTLDGRRYFAGGIPWFVALFGRDSIVTALETLAFMPDRAEDTLRLLAAYQGTREDAWRDEAPGKIMHERRVGEMAHLNEVPQTPYFGSVDATPLFLILMARHAAWTGRIDLFVELRRHVDAAMNWIDGAIARGGGYLVYAATNSSHALVNKGWKDSSDAIVNADGSIADPPIALVEVQGYVYMAKLGLADLYRRAGDFDAATRLAREAEDLRLRFERDFWLDAPGIYALALQRGNRPAAVASSNAAQALWTGIVSRARAASTATRLMQDDMFSGWGIRTLGSRERRYNPIGYHTGTVWPHDNAIAVAGFRRYGCLDEALRVMTGMIDAATHFDHERLPEVFGGFSRHEFAVPVHYPVACHPQAFAAASVPFMIESALGLRPDAFNSRLYVESPVLPEYVRRLTIDRLRVGDASVSIRFVRDGRGTVIVDDVKVDGTLDVTCDLSAAAHPLDWI